MKKEYLIVIKSELKFDFVKLNNILKSFDKDFELVVFEQHKPFRFKKITN